MTRHEMPAFDGHNDVLSRLHAMHPDDPAAAFIKGYDAAIDLEKARSGGFAGGFFAIYVPPIEVEAEARRAAMEQSGYDLPMPPELERGHAENVTLEQAAILKDLETAGALRICSSVADIRSAMDDGIIAAIMHLEGAEAIDADLAMLDRLHDLGLRSIGPVWSRSTIFAWPVRHATCSAKGGGATTWGHSTSKHSMAL